MVKLPTMTQDFRQLVWDLDTEQNIFGTPSLGKSDTIKPSPDLRKVKENGLQKADNNKSQHKI